MLGSIAKNIAIGFGIAVILPMLVHYGVSTVSPDPKYKDYVNTDFHPSPTEEQMAEQKAGLDRYEAAQERFQKHLFIAAAPIGILAVIIGSFISVAAIGAGLIFGGIFTLIDGYFNYWSHLHDALRFFSLLIAFITLIVIGYRKVAK